MTQRTQRYLSSNTIAQQPRIETLHGPVINWRAVRRYLLPITLLTAAVVLYLMQSTFATTSELDIAALAKQRETILHHNAQVSAEIAALENPGRIHDRAYALGLVDTTSVVRLPVQPSAPDAQAAAAGAASSEDETFWQHLAGNLAQWLAAAIH